MNRLVFHRVRAENVLCFGKPGINIDFDNYGNLVLIRGINYDNPGEGEDRSNGSGKSSIPELFSIALYGCRIKEPSKNKISHIIHSGEKSGEVELVWNDYRLVRSFRRTSKGATSKLRLWKSPNHTWNEQTEITRGTLRQTQTLVEEIIGLNHFAFCSVFIFDDSERYQFLEMDLPRKREFIELLFNIHSYRDYYERAKEIRNENRQKISMLENNYEFALNEVRTSKRMFEEAVQSQKEWENRIENKKHEIEMLKKQLDEKKANLSKLNRVAEEIKSRLEGMQEHRQALERKKIEIEGELVSLQKDIKKCDEILSKFQKISGYDKCPTCYGKIDKNNFGHVISETNEKKDSYISEYKKYKQMHQKVLQNLHKLSEHIVKAESITSQSEDKRAKLSINIGVLNNKISMLEQQLNESVNPYNHIVEQNKKHYEQKLGEAKNIKKELDKLVSMNPYYEFWVKGFSDQGIRRYILKNIVDLLNDRVNYFLNILIDGKISVHFDEQLQETIFRNEQPASYASLSKGEARRVNLAVSQALADIMMANAGVIPNLVFFDEITGGCIDRAGIPGVYQLVKLVSQNRKVFVTTHNENMLELLSGEQVIRVEKRNGKSLLSSNDI